MAFCFFNCIGKLFLNDFVWVKATIIDEIINYDFLVINFIKMDNLKSSEVLPILIIEHNIVYLLIKRCLKMTNSSTNAILVLGPESSGTRLVTRILIKAGCLGSDEHIQKWDDAEFPSPEHPIVFRRSVPHGGKWPDIQQYIEQLRQKGYYVQAVVTARDWHAACKSQMHHHHVKNEDEGYKNLKNVYPYVFKTLDHFQVPYIMINYESIIANHLSINETLKFLQLPQLTEAALHSLSLYNGNEQWYKFLE